MSAARPMTAPRRWPAGSGQHFAVAARTGKSDGACVCIKIFWTEPENAACVSFASSRKLMLNLHQGNGCGMPHNPEQHFSRREYSHRLPRVSTALLAPIPFQRLLLPGNPRGMTACSVRVFHARQRLIDTRGADGEGQICITRGSHSSGQENDSDASASRAA